MQRSALNRPVRRSGHKEPHTTPASWGALGQNPSPFQRQVGTDQADPHMLLPMSSKTAPEPGQLPLGMTLG